MVVVVAAVLLPSSSCSVKLVSLKGIRKGGGISTNYYTPKIPTEGTPQENSCRRNTICMKHWFKKKMEGIICQGQGDIRFFCLQKL
ncbi:hypothetical protein BDA96_08G140000 [Sorghum bicolor]|uniref:Secreted protein n=1 Tax=Sorghum bicolor TaxID=4558 RepID=A0A921QGL2_SORBI|nr:hypothetical protein BDA96_08G140000 [Sorghum bicolor]